MKKKFLFLFLFMLTIFSLVSCTEVTPVDGSYDFIVYISDSDNSDLSDNVIVSNYKISYYSCKTVTDTLIRKGSCYFFTEYSNDYLILKDSGYGLTYSEGYFSSYSECSAGVQIDVSWSYAAVNGVMASTGIGATPLDGLVTYGFVINGWK